MPPTTPPSAAFRVALAQINPTVGDLQGNTQKVLEYIQRARDLGADLVAFPELVLTGYPPEDLLLSPAFLHDNRAAMERVVAASRGLAVVVGFADLVGKDTFNAAALAWDGTLVDVYHKIHLPNYGVFDEVRYFKRGDTCPVYTVRGVEVGVNVCEDIWYAAGPVPVQRGAGATVIVNINGSPYHTGKRQFREEMLATRARDNGVYVAYVNTVGGQDELVFDGSSVVVGPDGEVIARAAQFQEELLVVDLDPAATAAHPGRATTSPLDLQAVGAPRQIHVSGPEPHQRPPLPPRTSAVLEPAEEVYGALLLGTRDYVRKNRFQKVLVSLSGGIDSTLVCCVAVDALGKENVVGVAMPSRYSSEGSLLDAQALADNLGIPLWVVPIEAAHRVFEETLEPHFEGTQPNVAEQNVQARIRGNLLMALSNKFNWLVLTTGNKSELAMGYATMYGDMAGGFAVIKDLPKTLVYQLSHWRNAHGDPAAPIPNSVLEKPPSAELKPDQRDEDDLPPYSLLDRVLEAYVEQARSYQEILGMGFAADVVERVLGAVDRSEFKRRQGPLGIKITPKAFGRDRRMPIVNHYSDRGLGG
jgi:NAD+ synthase (glutamine-hydrolysing)